MSVSINVALSTSAFRRLLDMLDAGPYTSVDELVEALIVVGDRGPPVASREVAARADDVLERLVRRPSEQTQLSLADSAEPSGQLQFLTNRFGPLKLATRVLANMAAEDGWPALDVFQERAAAAARMVGQRLRAEDIEHGNRGTARRWVAYPVGEDERAALQRYIYSFTLFDTESAPSGPLAQLGLATINNGRAALTERGWELAAAASPTLDEHGDATLSAGEALILRAAIRDLPAEAEAVAEFLRAVHIAAGRQGRVDELLGTWHADWTADRAAAERAALLGRLGELGVLRVSGRGPTAQIELLDSLELEASHGRG